MTEIQNISNFGISERKALFEHRIKGMLLIICAGRNGSDQGIINGRHGELEKVCKWSHGPKGAYCRIWMTFGGRI